MRDEMGDLMGERKEWSDGGREGSSDGGGGRILHW